MEREEIYRQLREQIPYLQHHECTPRIMAATNILLDQLLQVEQEEDYDNVFGTYTA